MAKFITEKTASKEWDQLINRIRSRSTPLPGDSTEKRLARKKRGEVDRFFFMATYMPHYVELRPEFFEAWKDPDKEYDWVYAGFPPYGAKLFELVNILNKLAVVAGFRESAKSTLISRADVLHKLVFKLRRYIVFVAASETRAAQYTVPLKLELEHNLRIRQDFGDLVGPNQWTDLYYRTADGNALKGMGIDQNIRGEADNGARIDHLGFEDVEDLRSSLNPDQVEKYVKWIKSDALYAVNSTKWSGVYVCNYESKRSVAHELLTGENTKHYNKIVLRALIPNPQKTKEEKEIAAECKRAGFDDLSKSAWEYRHPTIRLKQEEQDDPTSFKKGRMQSPRGDADRDFDDVWFLYYLYEELKGRQFRNFGFLDPASGKKSENTSRKRSHSALIVISVTTDLTYYTRYAMIRRSPMTEMLDKMYDLDEELRNEGGVTWGAEDVALQTILDEVVEMKAKEKGRRIDFRMMPTPTNISKEDRILKKQRLIQKGWSKFDPGNSDQRMLIRGFLDFPQGSESGPMDGPDSWERCITLSESYMGARDRRIPKVEYESLGKRQAVFEKGTW